jgi:hypothetical protein
MSESNPNTESLFAAALAIESAADRALVMLKNAVALGYKDAARMKNDPTLETLRAREEFKTLLTELEEKAKK